MAFSVALSLMLVGFHGVAATMPPFSESTRLIDPNATDRDPGRRSDGLGFWPWSRRRSSNQRCMDARGPACQQYNGAMAQAFAALANAGQCGPNPDLKSWSCAECKEVGFDVVSESVQFALGRELFKNETTSILVAQVKGNFPGSVPRPMEPLRHVGEDCWDHCRKTPGYCAWCGVGNACCKGGDANAPKECPGTSFFGGSAQAQCVAPNSSVAATTTTVTVPATTVTTMTTVAATATAEKSVSVSDDIFGCVLSVRGSDNIQNWILNFDFPLKDVGFGSECAGCKATEGWLKIWHEIEPRVMSTLSEMGCVPGGPRGNLVITGHSLGAAVASLAMFHLQPKGYNVVQSYIFETPRAGNKQWSDAFPKWFGRKVPLFRISHRFDTVPRVPPQLGFIPIPFFPLNFKHAGSEVFFPEDDPNEYSICETPEDKNCGDRYNWHRCMKTNPTFSDHCHSPLGKHHSLCHCPVKAPPALKRSLWV